MEEKKTTDIPRLILCDDEELKNELLSVVKNCYDPEIPVNIFDLGLIYKIEVNEEKHCHIDMTLTSPACPVAGTLPPDVETRVDAIPAIRSCQVEVVWDPPWNPEMMSEAAKLELGF